MKKRVSVILICLAMTIALLPSAAMADETTFSDDISLNNISEEQGSIDDNAETEAVDMTDSDTSDVNVETEDIDLTDPDSSEVNADNAVDDYDIVDKSNNDGKINVSENETDSSDESCGSESEDADRDLDTDTYTEDDEDQDVTVTDSESPDTAAADDISGEDVSEESAAETSDEEENTAISDDAAELEIIEEEEQVELENLLTTYTSLSRGSSGSSVLALQNVLYNMGYLTCRPDGIFGGYTERAVKKFQMYNGLDITGTVDADTNEVLNDGGAVEFSVLSKGSSGLAVYNLQTLLKKMGYLSVAADGTYGNYTYNAVMRFQSNNDLSDVDGISGSKTSEKLFNSPAVISSSSYQYNELFKGMLGTEVLNLQKKLVSEGFLTVKADGVYGNLTKNAVSGFQLYNNITITGVADNVTIGAVNSSSAESFYTMKIGSSGKSVIGLQKELTALGYYTGSIDGEYGNMTYTAVSEFQQINGTSAVDGKSGRETMGKLVGSPLSKVYSSGSSSSTITPESVSVSVLSAAQQAIIASAQSVPTTAQGLCAGWVGRVLADSGYFDTDLFSYRYAITGSSYSYAYLNGLCDESWEGDTDFNANDYWAYICEYEDTNYLQPGMIIASRSTYTYLGMQFGHVGIYIGNDTVISSIGYIETTSLSDWYAKYNNTDYGSTVRFGFAPLL